jgi:hypothetical protein
MMATIPTLPAAQTDAPTPDVPMPRPTTRAMMAIPTLPVPTDAPSPRHLSTRSLHQHGKGSLVAESTIYEE